ncbi:60S ribosomal protein L29 [Camelus dromedarius]|uniref:60S ribosomal protein L29 n=1 Tax=Camelus dromedarius TaxID=9838 RepID=A0A5N4C3R5_CAMDR|nr:60S ribosomal protein L29 [Camelus dromedarius]
MRFAEKHNKKGLKEMQANNATATSARAEAVTALIKPKEVEPKIPKGNQQPQAQLCQPKDKDKDKAQTKATASAAAPALALAQALAQAPKGAQAPTKAPE